MEAPPPAEYPVDDEVAGEPMPWENPRRGWLSGYFGTLATGLHPIRDTPRAASGEVAPALRFALLTALPMMAVAGIIPFTHLLTLKPGMEVNVVGTPSDDALLLDVAKAAGIGLLASLLNFAAWAAPFASLARAFGQDAENKPQANPTAAGWRVALYRAWLLPGGMLLFYLSTWISPHAGAAGIFSLVFGIVPRMIILMHCQSTARYLGASPFGALAVSLMPLAVEAALAPLMMEAFADFIPVVEAPK